jgi:hypothetical protein
VSDSDLRQLSFESNAELFVHNRQFRRGRPGGRGSLWPGSKGDAVESRHARVSGRTFDGEDGSDGTRTRDLRRDRPAF